MAKRTFKQRLALARARYGHRARHGALMSMNAVKPLGIGTAVGAAAHLAGYYGGDKIGFVGTNWYGEPLVLAVFAMLLRRRPQMSAALAGAAGYSAAFNYRLQQYQTGKVTAPPFHQFTGSGSTRALPSAGEYDAGAMQNPAYFQTQ